MTDSYSVVHKRLRRQRGRASDLWCAAPTCDMPARYWAWQRTGPSATGVHRGHAVTYGLDIEDYSPMCASHATMLDQGGSLTHCRRGHERAVVGAYPNGQCRQCNRDVAHGKRRTDGSL